MVDLTMEHDDLASGYLTYLWNMAYLQMIYDDLHVKTGDLSLC